MRRYFLLGIILCVVGCGKLGASSFDESVVLKATDEVMDDFRLIATCMSLEPTTYSGLQQQWNSQVQETLTILKSEGASDAFISRYSDITQFSNLIDGKKTLSETMKICHSKADVYEKYMTLDFLLLSNQVSIAINSTKSVK